MPYLLFFVLFISSLSAFAQSKVNPDISINTLFTYRSGSEGNNSSAEAKNGFALQEAELRMSSNLDAYFRGDIILAVEANEDKSNPGEPEYVVEPEEVFVDTLSIPGITFRLGKFYPYWGRSNQWHTHSQPFIDSPQTKEAIFGEEGFNEKGLAASYLIPTNWYFEVVAQVFSAENEAVFGSSSQDDVAGVLFIKNLWDLSDSSTLEFDLSYASGDSVDNQKNHVYNSALTYKSKLKGRKTFIATWEQTMAEKLFDDTPADQGRTSAMSSWVQYQFKKRWWAQARYEVVSNIENTAVKDITKNSALLAFVPSEFSAVRLQYDSIDDPSTVDTEQRVTLQLNLTMGAHPAHDY